MSAASCLSVALLSASRSARNGLCCGGQSSRVASLKHPCHSRASGPCSSSLAGRWVAGGPGQYRGHSYSIGAATVLTSPALRVSYTTVYVPSPRVLHHHIHTWSNESHCKTTQASHRGPRLPYTALRSPHRTLPPLKLAHLPCRTLGCSQNQYSAPHRSLHTSRRKREKESSKPSSQVERTVKDLKEKAKAAGSPLPHDKTLVIGEKKSLWVRIKEEVLHYYHGFRLLVIDTRIGCKFIWRLANGETLSRREHRQLIRTTSDLFRLLPFSVFIIIPFMEVLLPVALKLFPGMLPSTFETANEKEAKMKKKLKMKLEMAKFLQQTLDSMAVEAKGRHSDSAKAFVMFFEKITKSGGVVSNEEILKFSKLFEDEITLDSMSRPQLTALCRLLEMQPFGTNNFLRFQLRMKLRSLAADDKIIQGEGVDSLAVWELQQACRARGMRAYGLSEERMRLQLTQWLELSLKEKVPPSLLLLSRTLYLPENVKPSDTLVATISSLPEEVATLTKAAIGKREGKIDNLTRLEVIRAEERRIAEDKQELKKVEEERKAKEERIKKKAADEEAQRQEQEAMKRAAENVQAEVLGAGTGAAVDLPPTANQIISEGIHITKATVSPSGEIKQNAELDGETLDRAPTLVDKAEVLSEEMPKPKILDTTAQDQTLTSADLRDVEEALENIGVEKRKLIIEEKELSELKSEMADYQEDIEDFKKALVEADIKKKEMRESKAARRLFSRVNKMVTRMEPLLAQLGQEKDHRQKLVDAGQAKDMDKAELVSLKELSHHLSMICHAPDASKVTMIADVLAKMDFDHDGAVEVDQVLHVLHLLLHEPGGVSPKLFEEVIQMMAKEEKLESAQLIQRALRTTLPKPKNNSSNSAGNPGNSSGNPGNSGNPPRTEAPREMERTNVVGDEGVRREAMRADGEKQAKHRV